MDVNVQNRREGTEAVGQDVGGAPQRFGPAAEVVQGDAEGAKGVGAGAKVDGPRTAAAAGRVRHDRGGAAVPGFDFGSGRRLFFGAGQHGRFARVMVRAARQRRRRDGADVLRLDMLLLVRIRRKGRTQIAPTGGLPRLHFLCCLICCGFDIFL